MEKVLRFATAPVLFVGISRLLRESAGSTLWKTLDYMNCRLPEALGNFCLQKHGGLSTLGRAFVCEKQPSLSAGAKVHHSAPELSSASMAASCSFFSSGETFTSVRARVGQVATQGGCEVSMS